MTEERIKEITAAVDHTLLTQVAAWEEIRSLCEEAMEFKTASVCIPPSYVRQAAEYVSGRIPICSVIGFPNGYETTAVKGFEARNAISNGAEEIDMVINLGWVKDHCYEKLEDEIRTIKFACGDKILKVIVETCLLTEEEKIELCRVVTAAGADYIKTSTGFAGGGATFADVELFAKHVGNGVKIKAAGGISTLEDASRFLELGASRLGTSRAIRLIKEEQKRQ